jgi:CelD/BcsL family acetyltransferase involved in cellulose biosynthesis
MGRIVEINDFDRLTGLELLWSALLTRTAGASFFQSLDWLRAYWNHVGRDQRFRILIAYAGGEAIGIVPLTVAPERTKLGDVQVLTYPYCPGGHFFGPLGPHPAATLMLAMQHIQRTPRDWHVLDLRPIDRRGRDRGRTRNALKLAGLGASESICRHITVVTVTDKSDVSPATCRSPRHDTFQGRRRGSRQLGRVRYVRYRPRGSRYGDDDPRWDLYDLCVALGAAVFRGRHALPTGWRSNEGPWI